MRCSRGRRGEGVAARDRGLVACQCGSSGAGRHRPLSLPQYAAGGAPDLCRKTPSGARGDDRPGQRDHQRPPGSRHPHGHPHDHGPLRARPRRDRDAAGNPGRHHLAERDRRRRGVAHVSRRVKLRGAEADQGGVAGSALRPGHRRGLQQLAARRHPDQLRLRAGDAVAGATARQEPARRRASRCQSRSDSQDRGPRLPGDRRAGRAAVCRGGGAGAGAALDAAGQAWAGADARGAGDDRFLSHAPASPGRRYAGRRPHAPATGAGRCACEHAAPRVGDQ